MARIIDWHKEERQEWCPHCGVLVGYLPEEKSSTCTDWEMLDDCVEPMEFRFKVYYIICPNCGEIINISSVKQFIKKGSKLYDN